VTPSDLFDPEIILETFPLSRGMFRPDRRSAAQWPTGSPAQVVRPLATQVALPWPDPPRDPTSLAGSLPWRPEQATLSSRPRSLSDPSARLRSQKSSAKIPPIPWGISDQIGDFLWAKSRGSRPVSLSRSDLRGREPMPGNPPKAQYP